MSANGHSDPDLHAIDRALGPRKPDGGALVGATVRDFFAAKAMAALIMKEGYASDEDGEFVARCAYEFADAMLTERDKRAEPTP